MFYNIHEFRAVKKDNKDQEKAAFFCLEPELTPFGIWPQTSGAGATQQKVASPNTGFHKDFCTFWSQWCPTVQSRILKQGLLVADVCLTNLFWVFLLHHLILA